MSPNLKLLQDVKGLVEGKRTPDVLPGHIFRLQEERVQIITPLIAIPAGILLHLLCARLRAKGADISLFPFHFHSNPLGWVLCGTLQILWVPCLVSAPITVAGSEQASMSFV